MKKPVLFIALQCSFAALIAQPTLTSAWNPGIGKEIRYHDLTTTTGLSEGSAGANQTWNFSTVGSTSYTTSYLKAPADDTTSSNYPGVTYIETYDDGEYTFSEFMKEGNDSLTTLGVRDVILETGISFVYENPLISLIYPFTYETSFSDVFKGQGTNASYLVFRNGDASYSADAWGTLTTPIGTFANTLRVKTVLKVNDNINFNSIPNPPAISNDSSVTYSWISPELPGVILFSITNGVFDNEEYSSGYYGELSGVGFSAVQSALDFTIIPNPASTHFSILIETGKLKSAGIYSVDGRLVRSITSEINGSSRSTISTSGISPGVYLVQLETKEGVSSKRLVIQ
jgi:hypothetical protein